MLLASWIRRRVLRSRKKVFQSSFGSCDDGLGFALLLLEEEEVVEDAEAAGEEEACRRGGESLHWGAEEVGDIRVLRGLEEEDFGVRPVH